MNVFPDGSLKRALASAALAFLAESSHATDPVTVVPSVGLLPDPSDITFVPQLVGGISPDSPDARVDPNLPSSRFTGVVNIFLDLGAPNRFICSGTLITPTRVLTAGHCLDGLVTDGQNEFLPSQVTVNINYNNWIPGGGPGGSPTVVPASTYAIQAAALQIHPSFTGFNNPNINDDLAVITLSSPAPAGVAIYPIWPLPLTTTDQIVMAGYGYSGTGVTGQDFSYPPTRTQKRIGGNVVDATGGDDDGGPNQEVYLWDFDAPDNASAAAAGYGTYGFSMPNGPTGGPSLGNSIEAGGLGGDSGGPAFIDSGGQLFIAGVHTFGATFSTGQPQGVFGSGGGGIILAPYREWALGIPEASTTSIGVAAAGLAAFSVWRRRAERG